jgi:hypothetical protein
VKPLPFDSFAAPRAAVVAQSPRMVYRVTVTRRSDGVKLSRAFDYSTGASFTEDDFKRLGDDCKCEFVAWDGVESVSGYNGD